MSALIYNGMVNDSIITALELKIAAMSSDISNLEKQVENLEKDQQLGNQQNAILSDAFEKAQRLIKWLKLKSTVFAGTAAAILLYSLTIGAQR